MVDNIFMKINHTDFIANDQLTFNGNGSNTYGYYDDYKFGTSRVRNYKYNGVVTISGSLRKYYFDKHQIEDYWKYNLTQDNLIEIGYDLNSIGIDTDKLKIISYEFGPTLEMTDIVEHIESFKNGISNHHGITSFKGISKRDSSKTKGINKSQLLRVYSPELKYKQKTVDEDMEYTRFEDYIPKGTKKYLDLDRALTYSELCQTETLTKIKNRLIEKIERIIFINDADVEVGTLKKNKLTDLSLSRKKNRIIAQSLSEIYEDTRIKTSLYNFIRKNNDSTITKYITDAIDEEFRKTIGVVEND
jgi:hypothetical protein